MKRSLCLLLAMLMMVGMLAGCGSSNSSDGGNASSNSSDTPAAPVDPLAPMEEPVTLTSFFEISGPIQPEFSPEALEEKVYTQKQREATNVTVEYLWYATDSADDSDQKKNTAIATGDIPDFMIVDRSQLALLAKTDLINKDIDTLFDTYASDLLKEWTNAEGTAAMDSATFGGKVVAIPLVASSIDLAPFLWIRQDWLDNLGLKVPTTMEELYDVMVAFRDNDPDGNGKNDTVGMVMHKNFLTTGTGDAVGLFNGFNAYPRAWVEDGNGGLIYGSVAPEAKNALEFLAKLYAEGLIQEDFSTMDDMKATEMVASSTAGIQYGASWNSVWPLDMARGNVPEARWTGAAIVGAEGLTAHPQITLNLVGYAVINSECEHPEAVIKLLNFWVETQGNSTAEEYQSYQYMSPDGLMMTPQHWTMLKCYSPTQTLEDYHTICKVLENNDESLLTPTASQFYPDVKGYLDGDESKAGPYANMGPENSSYSAMAVYYDNDMFMFDKFTGSQTKSMGSKMSIVDDKVYEYYTKVIMGVSSLDDWDSFVQEVNTLGLADITAEVNEWYAAK